MDPATYKKLESCMQAYERRFKTKAEVYELRARMGAGGYAYVENLATGHKARFDVSAWRIRFVDVTTPSVEP